MQFKDLGSLFDGFGELNFKHASKASSFADLDEIDKNTIKGLFKIDSNDISDFTMAQIQAKASTMGLTESLTDELMAMSKDADFTAKAKVGKVTWGEALKEGSTNADQIGKALMKSSDVSDKAKKKLSEVYDKFGSGSQVYQKQLENIINGANGLDDISGKFTTLGADVQKSTGMFESAGNIIKGFFASIKGYIPILAVAGTAFAAFKLWDYSQTGYTTLTPSTIIFSSYYKDGESDTRNDYLGRFLISESTDGLKYSTKYTSAKDEHTVTFTPSSEILCELGKYNTDGIGTISIYAIDSRGNVSDTVKKSFTVLPYSLPRFSVINLKRLNDYESEIVLDFQGVISKLSVNNVEKNTIKTVGYRYAEEGSSYPTNFSVINGVTISSTSSEYILSFVQNTSDDTFGITGSGSSKLVLDNNKSYNFQFYIRDSFSNEDHYELNIEQGVPTMFIGDNKQVSVGMIPDIARTEKLQVGSDIMATDSKGEKVGILDSLDKMIIISEDEPIDQPIGGLWLRPRSVG